MTEQSGLSVDLLTPSWPPPFSLLLSPRAKYIRLRMQPGRGLQIVIPSRHQEAEALAFLNKKRSWVEKQLATGQFQPVGACPTEINLLAIEKCWFVRQLPVTTKKLQLLPGPNDLVLFGPDEAQHQWISLLKGWIKEQAKDYLTPWIYDLARDRPFKIQRVTIKDQQTRWGSCSQEKTIHLNFKLLFLPRPVVEYVLIHELCHTVHLNHSARYWRLVEHYVPDYAARRAELRQANHLLPAWVNGS